MIHSFLFEYKSKSIGDKFKVLCCFFIYQINHNKHIQLLKIILNKSQSIQSFLKNINNRMNTKYQNIRNIYSNNNTNTNTIQTNKAKIFIFLLLGFYSLFGHIETYL